MSEKKRRTPATIALHALTEIKAATQSFDSGKVNLFDALETIRIVIDAYRHSLAMCRRAA
jgi:hypothetical protein